jgi:hypothetical protein
MSFFAANLALQKTGLLHNHYGLVEIERQQNFKAKNRAD